MAYTAEQAVNHVVGRGYSHKTAKAIVAKLGPQQVFEGAGAASSGSGEASKYVQSFGYSQEAADKIVRTVEPHIVLTAKGLDKGSSKTHSFWDPNIDAAVAAPAQQPQDDDETK